MINGANNGYLPQNSGFGFIEKITNKDLTPLTRIVTGANICFTKFDTTDF